MITAITIYLWGKILKDCPATSEEAKKMENFIAIFSFIFAVALDIKIIMWKG